MKTKKLFALVLALVVLLTCLGVTAFAATDDCPTCGGDGLTGQQNDATCTDCFGTGKIAYLDLDATTTDIKSSKEIEQKYSVTVNEGDKSNVTKVQVSWSIPTIEATVTQGKTWNTENLTWEGTDEATAEASDIEATFNFVNRSSVKIYAGVVFSAESGINATPAYKDNGEAGDGKIALETKAESASNDINGIVKVTVPADKDFFKTLSSTATNAKYGTYTVSISDNKTAQSAPAGTLTQSTKTATGVTLTALEVTGNQVAEYAKNTTNTAPTDGWQDSPVFNDLTPGTTYYFFARYKATDTENAGEPTSALSVTTDKLTQTISAPEATASNIKATSVTLTAVAAGQGTTKYAKNTTDSAPTNDADWQTSTEFTGLSGDTDYYFFARYEGNSTYEAVTSTSTKIKTAIVLKAIQQGTEGNKVNFLPAFADGQLSSVMGTAKFTDKDGKTDGYDALNNATTMADLATAISAKGAENVYVNGVPTGTFYGTYDRSWEGAFGSVGTKKTHTDFTSGFKTILSQKGLPSDNVYGDAKTSSWGASDSGKPSPTLSGVSYLDFYNAYSALLSSSANYVWTSDSNSWRPALWMIRDGSCVWGRTDKLNISTSETYIYSVVLCYSFN